jgi:hypothetical protein
MSGTGRVAIKLGPPATAGAKQLPSRTGAPSALGKRPRPIGLADDSESEGERDRYGKHEAITYFGAEPARKAAQGGSGAAWPQDGSDEPLVIPSRPNRDWTSRRQDSRRHGRRPPHGERPAPAKELEAADPAGEIKWGLTVKPKTEPRSQSPSGAPTAEQSNDSGNDRNRDAARGQDKVDDTTADIDKEALAALLGKGAAPKNKLVIMQESEGTKTVGTGGRYGPDVGEVATMADYEAIGTGDFGAALLRGMGWDGKNQGEAQEVKRRPNLAGLGAKKLEGAEELGSWNQKAGKPRPPRLNEYAREEERRREKRRERQRGV